MERIQRSLIIFGVVIFVCCGCIASINYVIDPLWCFDNNFLSNIYKKGFDERQQKTNLLTFHKGEYDTLVLGSSRMTYLWPKDVPGCAFNYAVSAGRPNEFLPYANYIQSKLSQPLSACILGLSFFETNAARKLNFEKPQQYIEKSISPLYRYKMILSMNLLFHSICNIKKTWSHSIGDMYIRKKGNIQKEMVIPSNKDALMRVINRQIQIYRSQVYGGKYTYNLNNKKMYKEMRDGFAGTHFYVCITPVSRHLLSLLMEEGRWTDYARWLKELVEVYGEVWNFMYLNEVTENVPEYFMDAHHTSPEVLSVMAKKLYGLPVAPRFKHFGLRMTQETLVDDLVYLHEHMPKIDTKPSP